ncbi:hypothetical protein CXF79_20605 [Colwellia sp. Bg11-28]|nr:hypothetical protein CXF79_20605 [Colwellia sp. Bg11-28]
MCSLITLSKYYSTKSKTLLAESFGQRLLDIFTALSPFYVEQPHDKGSALYKSPTKLCKNNLESSTGPELLFQVHLQTINFPLQRKQVGFVPRRLS